MLNKSHAGTARTDAARGEAQSVAAASFHDLLVFLDESPAAANALAYAEALTRGENTTALMFGLMADYPVSFYSEVPVDSWLVVQRQAEQDAAALEERLRARLARDGSGADLRRADVVSGEEGRVIALQARYADATVIGWSADGGTSQQKTLFEGALFQSGRPVMLVPEHFSQRQAPRTILVAWSAERESARALHDAMPLLRSAGQVRIVVVDNGTPGLEKNPGDDIARHLARHDIKVDVKHVPAGGELTYKVLLNEARFLGADMLVMGGYGHSRTGEWLFGGVTRDMLGAADIPLLMSH